MTNVQFNLNRNSGKINYNIIPYINMEFIINDA